MIQTGIKLDKIREFLIEHLSILIVLPAFIGGLWQALELMSISIPYIRFFSISQIVPDGILILMFLVICSAFFLLGLSIDTLFFIKDKTEPTYVGEDDYEIYRKEKLRNWIFTFFILYISSVFYFEWFVFDKTNFSDLKTDIGISLTMIFWLNLSLNKCYYFAKEKYKHIFKFCNFLLFMFYIILCTYFSKHIHNIFTAPSNIMNIEQVKIDVAHKYPNTKQKILYFNDKYIFIKIINKIKMDKKGKILKHTSEKIYIMKLESLFEN